MTLARFVRRISGSVKPGSAVEVFLRIEPDADPRLHAPTSTHALIRTGLADRFDGQTLHLGPGRISADPCKSRVDHIPDARHGQRCFSHVRRQHDSPPAMRLEDTHLLVSA